VLLTSSAVKDHWLTAPGGVWALDGDCDCCPPARACWRGGEVRALCWGGVGAAGGTSRRRVGDRDDLSWREPDGTLGGWYPSLGGR
jgi:hypothetical protein